MAVGLGDVRVEESLRIKIGEAKNIPPRSHGGVGSRDVYCTVNLDQEEIARTITAEKTFTPFFGEEFQFEIPRPFRFLSFYLYDRDWRAKQDKALGKVAIKKEELHKYHGKDHWFALLPVDADSEVKGKVHIEIRHDEYLKNNNTGPNYRLNVKIAECSDLTIINGSCDPYASVTLCSGPSKQETKKTKVRKKTICPQFDESFFFDLQTKGHSHDKNNYNLSPGETEKTELRIVLWHDCSGVFGNVFMGEVRIPLHELDLINGHNAWYFLQPREISRNSKTDLGSLRLKIYYTSDHVFSGQYYDSIRHLLLESPSLTPITSSAAYILGEVVSNKIDAAQPLVRIFMHHGRIVCLIKALAEWEISKVTDPNTIFRGNTLGSKCMDEFMKQAGLYYLHDTLKMTIDEIFTDRKPCEIDPTRLNLDDNIDTNMANLQHYVEKIFRAIVNSALVCPPVMREVFHVLREAAIKYFPDNKEVRYLVISGFVFLRFFAPAILGPKLFELRSDSADSLVNRTLTLISKTIQSIGNLVSSRSSNQLFKEDYMAVLFKHFIDEAHMEEVRTFLDIISTTGGIHSKVIEAPIVLKEGVMIKRAQGRKRFGLKNFKKRFFQLTTQELFYSKAKGDLPLCRIPIYDVLAVERLQENSFKMSNMFQVVQPMRALYIQANNCVEEKEWIDILSMVCQTNKNRLKRYHPAAFVNGHWLCCKTNVENTPGCTPVTGGLPPDIGVKIDSDREIERIHSLFLGNMETLEKLLEACESQAVYTGEKPLLSPPLVIEDTKSCFETLSLLLSGVISLEQEHKQHMKQVYRQTKYGSEQAPIGDDNYLMMAAAQNYDKD